MVTFYCLLKQSNDTYIIEPKKLAIRGRIIFAENPLVIVNLIRNKLVMTFFYHNKITIFPLKTKENIKLSIMGSFVFK
jgi:hypothetical protein